jgi:hypothetical protein
MPAIYSGAGLFGLLIIVLLIVCLSGGGGTPDSEEVVQGPPARLKEQQGVTTPGKRPEIPPLNDPDKKPKFELIKVETPSKGAEKDPKLPPEKDLPPEIPHHAPEAKDPPPAKEMVTDPVKVAGPRKDRAQLLPDLPALPPVEFKVFHPAIARMEGVRKSLRLAVTPKQYDDMGKLLAALGKGYHYTQITPQDLYNLTRLTQFDVVFLTCAG